VGSVSVVNFSDAQRAEPRESLAKNRCKKQVAERITP
jgi:hypothetical protein